MDATFLVVDDDPVLSEQVTWSLKSSGHAVLHAGDIASAIRILAGRHVDMVLLDMYLPDGVGLEVLAKAMEQVPPPQVLMMTARADVRSAVEAMRKGAVDFLEKPLDLDDLAIRVERALAGEADRRKLAAYETRDRERMAAPLPVSQELRDVFAIAKRVASTPMSSALLLGESGVGKEVVAAHIHEASDRRRGPFVRVNLAAIPDSMVEAELFGSVRGAFTDAKRDRSGHFASAEGGTILLDEICEFRIELQSKLLRVLEERRFFPVGSDRERRLNARVIAATNRDPIEMIAKGRLREDLYYRIATVTIRIPPLRERCEDVIPLAEHFCSSFRVEFRRPKLHFGDATRQALLDYDWPGNVRELRNVVERASMLSKTDEIGVEALDLPIGTVLAKSSQGPVEEAEATSLADVERQHIARILSQVGGSRTRAAKLLGISRSTLWEKAKRLGLV